MSYGMTPINNVMIARANARPCTKMQPPGHAESYNPPRNTDDPGGDQEVVRAMLQLLHCARVASLQVEARILRLFCRPDLS